MNFKKFKFVSFSNQLIFLNVISYIHDVLHLLLFLLHEFLHCLWLVHHTLQTDHQGMDHMDIRNEMSALYIRSYQK